MSTHKISADDDNQVAGDGGDGELDLSVYVNGLPYDWTEEKIMEFFSICGKIVRVKAPTWHDTGRLRGYAIIVFSNKAEVSLALKKNREEVISLDGTKKRYLVIEMSQGKKVDQIQNHITSQQDDKKGNRRATSIFLKNLPYDATEDEIFTLLLEKTKIDSCKKGIKPKGIRIVSQEGRSKGFAFVDYASADQVTDIINHLSSASSSLVLKGRQIIFDYGSGQAREGFHLRKEAYDSKLVKPLPPKKRVKRD